MAKKKLTVEELKKAFLSMDLKDARRLCNQYSKMYGKSITSEIDRLSLLDLEEHLESSGINSCCPHCGSTILVKNGTKTSGIQEYKCRSCGKKFTRFTGTFLEKAKYNWDIWVEFIYMVMNNFSLERIKQNLEDDFDCIGIDIKTVWNWRHKLMATAMDVPLPKLQGIVEIDETHIHEAQKGSRSLVNLYDANLERKPRKRKTAAKYGVMGAEFVTIICALDQDGRVAAKVSGLGKFDLTAFEYLFRNEIGDCALLCTDNNGVYRRYASKWNIIHYVRPSDYLKKIEGKTDEELKEMYENGEIDFITNRFSKFTYNQLKEFKEKNRLGLSRVNQFHSEFKLELVALPRGVNAQYIEEYTAWKCLLRNKGVETGHRLTTKDDAAMILKYLLEVQTNPLIKEIVSKDVLDLPKPSKVFLTRLQENTDIVRTTKHKGFVYDTETLGDSFSIKEQLRAQPVYILREMGKDLGIKGYTKAKVNHTYKLRQDLERHPDIEKELLKMREKYGADKKDDDIS